ncbi:beta-glucosidase 12-like isoform X2 [Corylus avellana]|uniref:beta-glucosidase 12-like isoform X2 n=1 Tax=Corylus avellana TaxID=13451 RepID=UPI00286C9211|nr:beta-glucosidase 12-like isoform X2 [Corylus avellana]
MAFQRYLVLGILLLHVSLMNTIVVSPNHYSTASLNRSSFPVGFIFGTASSSYQYEGAAKEGGRGPSIWDTFTHRYPGNITDHSNGDVAVDQYHRYKEDVHIMKEMGLDAYRFSISWSRVLPTGKLCGGVNKEGIKYYNDLINDLLAKGLKPFVTLFHWDLPQVLDDEYGGFSSPQIARQKGSIGITLVASWTVPYSNAKHNRKAALRALDFLFGWFMDPLTNGDYPRSMRSLVGNRLPKFSKEQSNIVNGSFDFIGLNYYTTTYAANAPHHNAVNASYTTDMRVNLLTERNGIPIGPKAASDWLYVYPRGIRDILLYTKTKYHNPQIYITENGIDEFNNASLSLEEALVDNHRIDYFYRHLKYLNRAIKDGVNVKGYFAWSLLDNFEWNSGYTVRFGINYVDYKNGLKRHPKLSAHWFKSFLKK